MSKWISWCDKIILYSFYLLFFFVPLFFTNDTSELFELNKMWLTWWLTTVIVGTWLCKMILRKKFLFQRTPLDIPLFLFLLSQIISSIFTLDHHVSFWGYYSRFNGGLLSTISYIALYYAFVSNLLEKNIQQGKERSLGTKSLFFIGGALLYIIGLCFSPPSSPSANDGKLGLFYLMAFVAFCLFVQTLSGSLFKRILTLTLISGAIVALWGLPSHFGYDPTCYMFRGSMNVSCWTDAFKPTVRIFSTLGQPDWMAAYVSALLPIAMAFSIFSFFKKTKPNEKFQITLPTTIYLLLTTLLYLDLLYTDTKAGFAGFWIGNVVFWIGLFFANILSRKVYWKMLILFNAIFLIINFFVPTPIDQLNKFSYQSLTVRHATQLPAVTTQVASSSATQMQSPTTDSLDTGITDSGTIRLFVWQGAIAAWRAHPLFGTGVETFAFAYYLYRPVGHNMTSEWDYLYNKAHNEYLNYLATTGIFGLGTYLVFIGMFFFFANKYVWRFRADETKRIEVTTTLALISGYITILVSDFFGFSVVIINLFLFLLPALFFLMTGKDTFKKIVAATIPDKSVNINAMQWTGLVIVMLIAGYFELILFTDWNADKAYAYGNNLDSVGRYQDANPYLTNAVSMRPDEPVFQDELSINEANLAALYVANKDMTDAQKYAIDAKNLNDTLVSEYPNNVLFWKSRARIFYLLANNDPQVLQYALQAMQQANQLAPTDAKILYNLGVLYGQTGDIDQGITILQKTIQYKPDYRDAYFALGLFYHEKAIDKNGVVIDPVTQQKAVDTMHFILNHVSTNDSDVLQTLKTWGD